MEHGKSGMKVSKSSSLPPMSMLFLKHLTVFLQRQSFSLTFLMSFINEDFNFNEATHIAGPFTEASISSQNWSTTLEPKCSPLHSWSSVAFQSIVQLSQLGHLMIKCCVNACSTAVHEEVPLDSKKTLAHVAFEKLHCSLRTHQFEKMPWIICLGQEAQIHLKFFILIWLCSSLFWRKSHQMDSIVGALQQHQLNGILVWDHTWISFEKRAIQIFETPRKMTEWFRHLHISCKVTVWMLIFIFWFVTREKRSYCKKWGSQITHLSMHVRAQKPRQMRSSKWKFPWKMNETMEQKIQRMVQRTFKWNHTHKQETMCHLKHLFVSSFRGI